MADRALQGREAATAAMSIGADDDTAPLSVPVAAGRVLEFTQVARPADLPLILSSLTAAEIAAGVANLGRRLPEPVMEHVIAHGPPGARRTLAWQLRRPLRHAGILGYDTARRKLLRLADPEVDRALFGRLDQAGVTWVRAAILRDRTGPDGEAIVPADLRARLVDFLSTAVLPRSPADLANTDTGDPDFELLRVLAGARDQALALPAARILGLPGPLPAVRPGWRDQAWVQRWDRPGAGSGSWTPDWDEVLELADGHRDVAGDRGRFLGHVKGLDEAAAREDIPDDVRQLLVARYPQAAWHVGAPDPAALKRVPAALAALAPVWGDVAEDPEFRYAIRMLLIRGLSLGTLTAAEVLENAVPASAVLDLAWRADDVVAAAARGRADLAEELRARLRDRIGDDEFLWYTLLVRSFSWSGTVAELIDSVADLGGGPDYAMPPEGNAVDGDSANVLMTFAPRLIAEEFLGEDDDLLTPEQLFLLTHRPLAPGLIERALDPDAGPAALRTLLANRWTPRSVLLRLLRRPPEPLHTHLNLLTRCLDPDIRYSALEALEKQGVGWAQFTPDLEHAGEAYLYQLIAAAPTAERVFLLLRKLGRYLGPDTTLLLYGRLAAEAGPEPVWEVATFLAGGLENVDPWVRRSMAAGTVEPLLQGAEVIAGRDLPGVTTPDPQADPEPHPDDPSRWPLEDAVRRHLDGRPERWRALVRRLMVAGELDYRGLVALVEAVAVAVPDEGDDDALIPADALLAEAP